MSVGTQTHAQFYSIFNGKICRSHKAATAASITRTNKMGNVVHEEFFDYIDGVIVSIETREHAQYGKSWMIGLQDGEDLQYLQMQFSSGYSQAFLKILPNVDLSSNVKLIPNLKTEGDKKKSSLFITQHGKAVKWFYTKENKNDLPDLVKIRVKGKEQWDDTDQMEFLEAMVKDKILPQLPKGSSFTKVPLTMVEPGDSTESIDELPF